MELTFWDGVGGGCEQEEKEEQSRNVVFDEAPA
jgi:hypothetical protein